MSAAVLQHVHHWEVMAFGVNFRNDRARLPSGFEVMLGLQRVLGWGADEL